MKLTRQLLNFFPLLIMVAVIFGCGKKKSTSGESQTQESTDMLKVNKTAEMCISRPEDVEVPEGMVWIPGGTFNQGAIPEDQLAMAHEKPSHRVAVDGFFMDITEVTNAQFKKFIDETDYITVAERNIEWEEMKKQLPEGTPRPHDSIMQPGSLTFEKSKRPVPNLYDFSQWWRWTIGASWKQPNGPGSTIEGKGNHPVVHVSYEDALAYCEWAGRRLPTEAEWERAARGNKENGIYFWGNEVSKLSKMANTWEGEFPVTNSKSDGFERRAPVKSYPPNEFGLYDIAGNVWEWTSDWYNTNYYQEVSANNELLKNPLGADRPFNERNPYVEEKIIKGGSFLCNASYCASYRISSRMANSLDSSLEHLGFRTVASLDMLRRKN